VTAVLHNMRRRRAAAKIWPGWRVGLDRLPVAVLDVETTGLDPRGDHVVEVAIVIEGAIALESLVRPPRPGLGEAPHALTERVVRHAPSFGDLAGPIAGALAGRVVVAHNAPFDIAFLTAEYRRAGIVAPRMPFLCTAALPRLLGLEHPTRRLEWACHRFGITLERPHEAAADAVACAALFGVYAERAAADGLTLPDLARRGPAEPCVRSWAHPPAMGRTAASADRTLPRASALAS
jgi:DNA polymerase III epsilon subunit-like protein